MIQYHCNVFLFKTYVVGTHRKDLMYPQNCFLFHDFNCFLVYLRSYRDFLMEMVRGPY